MNPHSLEESGSAWLAWMLALIRGERRRSRSQAAAFYRLYSALETGRTVVQSAPTGYSAVVDWRGKVLAHTALGRRAVLQRQVRRRAGQTLATRLGETPLVGLAALAAAALAVARRRRSILS